MIFSQWFLWYFFLENIQADMQRINSMRSKLLWGTVILAILAGIGLAARSYMEEDVSFEAIPVAPVQRGTISISITESGTLQALQSVTLASEITSNRAKIVKIAPVTR